MYANEQGNAAATHNTSTSDYVIAAYLRISDQDDAKDESNSITYQRTLIKNHIASQEEFANAQIVEYVDDGISGSHTNRNGYQKLMADIQRGAVHCIIVKDLSRIGRNLIDVDDLLMNYLVVHDIRFIALGNNYDSLKKPLSNLELAIINLANQHYNRDLVQKSMSIRIMKMKRGEFLSCWAMFGYKKSLTERNKIIIDEESANYVRMMFSLAADGNRPPKIAQILNAQGIPTPSEYKKKNGVTGGWRTNDPDYTFWCGTKVHKILNDIRYTGTAVNRATMVKQPGINRVLKRPKDEWITVPDAHEAIVTQAEYDKAHEALRRCKWSDPTIDHLFYSKIRCAVCNRTLSRLNPKRPYFKCKSKYYTSHYDCPECLITQEKIEQVVLESIKVHIAVLIDHEEMKLATIRQNSTSKAELERKLQTERKAVRLLEESITKNITALVSGEITQEVFLQKKEIINKTISQKNEAIENLCEQLKVVTAGKQAVEERLSELQPMMVVEKLDRELVDLLIDKVLIHGENDIEIVWLGGGVD